MHPDKCAQQIFACKNSLLGDVVSWSSLKDEGSHKRSHDLICMSHKPPPKKTKMDDDQECIASPVLLEKEVQHDTKSDVPQAGIGTSADFLPIADKLKHLCNASAPLDDKGITLLWEELTSVEPNQV